MKDFGSSIWPYSISLEVSVDSDGDGVADHWDACPADPDNDLDGDGLCGDVDSCPFDPENDSDGDGICGDIDVCSFDPENDFDGDGICGDVDFCPYDVDNDYDGDSICGDEDNCPIDANVDQVDSDGDGIGDICDNGPPVAFDQGASTDEDLPVVIALTGDDPDGDPLDFVVTAGPDNGELSALVVTGSQAQLTYTPDPGYYGNDAFLYVVNDGQANSAEASVSISVTRVVANDVVLQGRITDRETGQPVVGASINRGEAMTDSGGYYELTGDQLSGATGNLLVQADGYYGRRLSYSLDLPLPNTLDLDLAPGGTIFRGVVLDAFTEEPRAGAQVYCSCAYNLGSRLFTDSNGFFEFTSSDFDEGLISYLHDGRQIGSLVVSADGFFSSQSYVLVSLPLPFTVDSYLIAPRNEAVLRGRITDRESGLPVAGASINRGATVTDTDGNYELTGDQLGGATGTLLVHADGYYGRRLSYSVDLPLPNTLDLDLAPGGAIFRGVVLDAFTEEPIAGAQVYCSCAYNLGSRLFTDSNGFFEFTSSDFDEGLISYLYDGRQIGSLVVSAGGFFSSHSYVLVSLPLPFTVEPYLIAPRNEAVLRGRITNRESGQPVAGASINRGATVTDADGNYELTGDQLSGATGTLLVQADGYYGRRLSYSLDLPLPTTLDLDLESGGTIFRGVVLDAFTEEPIAGAQVYCSCAHNLGSRLFTDSNGFFEFTSSDFDEGLISYLYDGRQIGSLVVSADGFFSSQSYVLVSLPLPFGVDSYVVCRENCFTNSDTDTIPDEIDNCPTVDNELQSDVDGDHLGDLCDTCPNDPLDGCDGSGSAAGEISPEEPFSLSTPDGGLSISAPPDAVGAHDTLAVTKTIMDDPEINVSIGPSSGLGNALAVYDLEPDGFVFDSPITMRLTADVTELVADPDSVSHALKVENLLNTLDIYLYSDTDEDGYADAFVGQYASCSIKEEDGGVFIASCGTEIDHFSTWALVTQLDTDGDGVPDNFFPDFDLCPDTPVETVVFNNLTESLIETESDGLATLQLEAEVFDLEGYEAEEVETVFTVVGASDGAEFRCVATSDWYGEVTCDLSEIPPDNYWLAIEGLTGCAGGMPGEGMVVVYDPDGPKSTGGGFVLPDEGSTEPAGGSGDKAHFSFVVKLDKNQVAVGNLNYRYQAAGLDFTSKDLNWYTVGGDTAFFEGTSTIDGYGLCTYRVSTVDGDLFGGNPDAFDITVWSGTDTGISPIHRAKNVLAGGSVVIHTK